MINKASLHIISLIASSMHCYHGNNKNVCISKSMQASLNLLGHGIASYAENLNISSPSHMKQASVAQTN